MSLLYSKCNRKTFFHIKFFININVKKLIVTCINIGLIWKRRYGTDTF